MKDFFLSLWEAVVRAWPLVTLALLAIVLIIVMPAQCRSTKTAETETKVATGQAGATISAAEEAGNTLAEVAANAAATAAKVEQGRAEVAAAPEGQKTDAARRAACRFKANRNKPECKQ